jgi:hypothetical protein
VLGELDGRDVAPLQQLVEFEGGVLVELRHDAAASVISGSSA